MSILRPSKEEILDHLRTSVITEAGKRTGFLGTTAPKLNVVREYSKAKNSLSTNLTSRSFFKALKRLTLPTNPLLTRPATLS